jgi:hypothetical protein
MLLHLRRTSRVSIAPNATAVRLGPLCASASRDACSWHRASAADDSDGCRCGCSPFGAARSRARDGRAFHPNRRMSGLLRCTIVGGQRQPEEKLHRPSVPATLWASQSSSSSTCSEGRAPIASDPRRRERLPRARRCGRHGHVLQRVGPRRPFHDGRPRGGVGGRLERSARRPDHYKNFTIVGILLMALLGALGGGSARDVLSVMCPWR